MYQYGTLKPGEDIFRRGKGKRENNRGNKPTRGTLHMEMSQQTPLYNYYILIKRFKKQSKK
jgi:hypothetical protein